MWRRLADKKFRWYSANFPIPLPIETPQQTLIDGSSGGGDVVINQHWYSVEHRLSVQRVLQPCRQWS